MKILFVDQYAEMGGAQFCLLDLLPAILEAGWKARLALPRDGPLAFAARKLGIEVQGIPWRGIDADIIYVNGPRLLPAIAAIDRRGARTVFHSHNLLSGWKRSAAMWAIRKTGAVVIANCAFTAVQWGGRARIVYNGVRGPAAGVPARNAIPRVGYIGRISPEKGVEYFVAAARQVDAKFVVYGAPLFGAGMPPLDGVEYAGWTNDVYEALCKLDLLVVPSCGAEATTRVILEAFAAGVTVVAMRTGGIPEVVEHGRTGFLADGPADLAPRIREALAADRGPITAAARERWLERHSLDRYRAEILGLLRGIG